MDGKVSVNVREIENGFVVSRSWCDGDKKGAMGKYHNEEVFMRALPSEMAKMFKKGYVNKNMPMEDDNEKTEKRVKSMAEEMDKDDGESK